MDTLLLLASFPLLRAHVAGRTVTGVRPVGRHGLHLGLGAAEPGLRLDTAPGRGAALLTASMPPRLRGGRGAWPELAGAADRDLADRRITALAYGLRPAALVVELEEARLALVATRRGTVLLLDLPGAGRQALPAGAAEQAAAALPALETETEPLGHDLLAVARRHAPEDPAFAEEVQAAASFLPRRLLETWLADPQSAAARLESFGERLCGRDAPVALVGGRPDEPARAGLDRTLRIELLAEAVSADEPTAEAPGLLAGLESWYALALEAERLTRRRQEIERLVGDERRRVGRALAALAREERGARPPEELRRSAEALLAAGPAARRAGIGWRVPDPRSPEDWLEVPAPQPGLAPHELAQRLYARARKEERGGETRRARRDELEARERDLAAVAATAAQAEVDAGLDALEGRLRQLGLGAGLAPAPAPSSRRTKPRETPAPPARVFHSPAGFEVLVGRSARQNDQLTFRVASPDDLWLHAAGYGGAHVVVRRAGRPEMPDEDLAFAAGLAAAFSQAPAGEPVDVTVCRRRHVRRPRGAPPGLVSVRKARTVRVVTPERAGS